MSATMRVAARLMVALAVVAICILALVQLAAPHDYDPLERRQGDMSAHSAILCPDAPVPPRLEPRAPIPIANETAPVFLLHILKTGGTTLSDMFAIMFDPAEIIPGSNRSDSIPLKMKEEYHMRKKADPQWRVGYGHHPYGLVDYLGFPVQPITILRDPTTHLRSVWKSPVFGQCKKDVSTFREWLTSPAFAPCSYIQSLTLTSKGSHYPWSLDGMPTSKEAAIEAKRHLEAMPWFGITDRWLESMCLMYYTFGWRPLASHEWKAQRVRHDTEVFDDETMRQLRKSAAADYELFDFATELFDKRLRQMQYEVINGAAPLGRPSTDVWLIDCLDLARGQLDPRKL